MMFLPLTKGDQASHTIWARAAAEEQDKAREVLDYETAVPQFQEWSRKFSDATMGKSLGNLRAMHNPRHLAGKIEEIVYNDLEKAIDVRVKILDPVDWAKVEEGAYTGLSIGGGYLKKWACPLHKGATRYTPRIAEISLVDSPCIPSARFLELQKSDGSVAEIPLVGHPRTFAEMLPPKTFAELRKGGFAAANAFASTVAAHPAATFAGRALKATKDAKDAFAVAGATGGLVSGGLAVSARRHETPAETMLQPPHAPLKRPNYMKQGEVAAAIAARASRRPRAGDHHLSMPPYMTKNADLADAIDARLEKLSGRGGASGRIKQPNYRGMSDDEIHAALGEQPWRISGDVAYRNFGPHAQSTPVSDLPRGAKIKGPDGARGRPEPASRHMSDAQHAQRIAAAKARWLKEGHHDLDPHFAAKREVAGAAWLGRDKKVAAVDKERAATWHGIADSQDAYDKLRQHLPGAANLMIEVPHQGGLLYNPEGVGDQHFDANGRPKQDLYMLHPAEADDWIAKHGKDAKPAVAKAAPLGRPLGLVDDIRALGALSATASGWFAHASPPPSPDASPAPSATPA